jgi:hypothetical protein
MGHTYIHTYIKKLAVHLNFKLNEQLIFLLDKYGNPSSSPRLPSISIQARKGIHRKWKLALQASEMHRTKGN